jgi:hypothetical protein
VLIGWVYSFSRLLTKLEAKPNIDAIKILMDEELKNYSTKAVVGELIEEKLGEYGI